MRCTQATMAQEQHSQQGNRVAGGATCGPWYCHDSQAPSAELERVRRQALCGSVVGVCGAARKEATTGRTLRETRHHYSWRRTAVPVTASRHVNLRDLVKPRYVQGLWEVKAPRGANHFVELPVGMEKHTLGKRRKAGAHLSLSLTVKAQQQRKSDVRMRRDDAQSRAKPNSDAALATELMPRLDCHVGLVPLPTTPSETVCP